jgi:hypothetical protein
MDLLWGCWVRRTALLPPYLKADHQPGTLEDTCQARSKLRQQHIRLAKVPTSRVEPWWATIKQPVFDTTDPNDPE